MVSPFDALSAAGHELTIEQLDNVDGGFVLVAIAVAGLIAGGIWGYSLNH